MHLFTRIVGTIMILILGMHAKGQLSGVISDNTSKEKLAGAIVTLQNGKMKFTKNTASTGEFSFQNLPFGNYQLSVEYIGYDKYSEPIIIATKPLFKNILLKQNIGSLAGVNVYTNINHELESSSRS